MFNEGVKLLDGGNPEAALREFQEVIRQAGTEGQKADALYNIAVCHVRLGHMDHALETARQALAADPALAQEIRSDEDFAPLCSSGSFQEALRLAEGATEFVERNSPEDLCSCIRGVDHGEVAALPSRDDSSLAREVQKSQRTLAIFAVVASVPMFLLGVADLTRVIAGFGLMFLVAGPASLIWGIVTLVRARRPFEACDASLIFNWSADQRFLLGAEAAPSTQRVLSCVLPSSRSRYQECSDRIYELTRAKKLSSVSYVGPEPKDVVIVEKGRLPPLAWYTAHLSGSTRLSGSSVPVAKLTQWAVRSPQGNWWLVLHAPECAEMGIQNV